MNLFMNKGKMKGLKGNDTKSIFTKSDVEKALKMSNLGKTPKGTSGVMGRVGKKVKPINMKVKDADDIFNPKV